MNIFALPSIHARPFESKGTLYTVTSELLYAPHKPFLYFSEIRYDCAKG